MSNHADLNDIFREVCDKMSEFNPELITVYYGEDAREEETARLSGTIEEKFSSSDVTVVYGGQPVYYYIISAE